MNPFQLIGLSVTCSESKYFTTVRRLCVAVLFVLCTGAPASSVPAPRCPRGARLLRGAGLAPGVRVGFSARERGWREETVGKVTFDQIGLVGFINLEVSRDVLGSWRGAGSSYDLFAEIFLCGYLCPRRGGDPRAITSDLCNDASSGCVLLGVGNQRGRGLAKLSTAVPQGRGRASDAAGWIARSAVSCSRGAAGLQPP